MRIYALIKHIETPMTSYSPDHQKSIKQFKIVIEKHPDGYVAYPIGVVGAIVGQGDTYEEALSDVKSA